jgi:hypothetical protein
VTSRTAHRDSALPRREVPDNDVTRIDTLLASPRKSVRRRAHQDRRDLTPRAPTWKGLPARSSTQRHPASTTRLRATRFARRSGRHAGARVQRCPLIDPAADARRAARSASRRARGHGRARRAHRKAVTGVIEEGAAAAPKRTARSTSPRPLDQHVHDEQFRPRDRCRSPHDPTSSTSSTTLLVPAADPRHGDRPGAATATTADPRRARGCGSRCATRVGGCESNADMVLSSLASGVRCCRRMMHLEFAAFCVEKRIVRCGYACRRRCGS